ncbi:hypothetical protein EHM69_05735 [candidate division KSB1 bacterium]|nr:MAG: hypothetical protein EHM69_05735 [candidate division KSB1 bacterium]
MMNLTASPMLDLLLTLRFLGAGFGLPLKPDIIREDTLQLLSFSQASGGLFPVLQLLSGRLSADGSWWRHSICRETRSGPRMPRRTSIQEYLFRVSG